MALTPMSSYELQAAVKTGEVVMAYFWSDWHEGCAETTVIMEKIGQRYDGRAIVASINADEAGFFAVEMNAYPLPMTIIFQDGMEVDRIAGAQEIELFDYALKLCVDPPAINPYELINTMGWM